MLRKEIGLRVKNIRLSMNMTKQKMADLLGISGQYLGMIERGKGTPVSYTHLTLPTNSRG